MSSHDPHGYLVDDDGTVRERVRLVCVECGETFRELERYRSHVHRDELAAPVWLLLIGAASGAIVGIPIGIAIGIVIS